MSQSFLNTRRIDDGTAPEHRYSSVEEFYRKEYFQAIDSIKGDLENRFMQESFLLVRKIERLLLDSANGKDVSISKEVIFMKMILTFKS